MKQHPFALALAACVAILVALAPATASARPGPQPEPIIFVGGFSMDCNLFSKGSFTPSIAALAEERTVDGQRTDIAAKFGVQGLPQGWVTEFGPKEGYDQCGTPAVELGRRFFDVLKARIAAWNAALPAGQAPVSKVDVLGVSYGATITRSCMANAGRAKAATATPGCAALVDDWLGVVPVSHGTERPWIVGCPIVFPPLCKAADTKGDYMKALNERYNGDVADRLGAGDETPQPTGTTPVEYTTMWAGIDGIIDPAPSAGLWGAVNYRLQAGAATDPKAPQLYHLNVADTSLCPGSPDVPDSGTWEWILWELLDVSPRPATVEESPRTYPTKIAPFQPLDCRQAPPGLRPWAGPAPK